MNSTLSQPYPNFNTGALLKRSLLLFVVILFFCDIAIFLSLAVSPRLEPQYWIGLLVLFGATLAWFSPETRWETLRTPLFFWCVLFLLWTLAVFVGIRVSHVEQFKEQIRTVVLLVTFLGVFLMARNELRFMRKLIAAAVIGGTLLNIVSLFHHGFWVIPDNTWGNRPMGFYPQPNESAIALIFGLALSTGVLRDRWRAPFAIFVLAGVIATFSREAVAGWCLVVACLCVFGFMRWRSLAVWLAVLAVCALLLGLVVGNTHLSMNRADFYRDQLGRFYAALGGFQHDQSAKERLQVLRLGWSTFLAHPLIGNGVGSTYHWSMPISTHNMYLLYMDDYGFLGLFLYPAIVWSTIHEAVGEARKLAWVMAIFLLFWGLLDHNVVQNYYSLFAISLTAAMSRISAAEAVKEAAPISAEAASG